MRDDLARSVFPVLTYGLALKERLISGERLSFTHEQSVLRGLLGGAGQNPAVPQPGGSLGARYALAAWLDEIFIFTSPWAELQTAHLLEWLYFQSNDRANKFWDQAQLAEASGDTDTLEVYYLCVMLGFRGKFRDQSDEVRRWRRNVEYQIAKRQTEPYRDPPARDPEPYVPPLTGEQAMDRMVSTTVAALLVLIAVASFLVVFRIGQ